LFTFQRYLESIQQIKAANTLCYSGTAAVDVSTESTAEHNTGQITFTQLKNKIQIDATYYFIMLIYFIELNRLYTTQLTVVNLQLYQHHVSALFGHHQAYKV